MKAAVYFGSREIYYDMATAYKSLLVNSDVDKIYLLIEDNKFPYPLHPAVETINISKLVPTLFNPKSPNYGSTWTYIGLIRAALTKVFPNLDRILSIDCDTVVLHDISNLWDLPMDDYYIAAVKEPSLSQARQGLYINAGVMMMNLAKMREDGIDDKMIYDLNTQYHIFVAQDVLNIECAGHIYKLPPEYNVATYTMHCDTEYKIRHFAGNLPRNWRQLDIVKQYRDMPPQEVRILHAERLANRQGA